MTSSTAAIETQTPFSREVFASYKQLTDYVKGEEAISHIIRQADDQPPRTLMKRMTKRDTSGSEPGCIHLLTTQNTVREDLVDFRDCPSFPITTLTDQKIRKFFNTRYPDVIPFNRDGTCFGMSTWMIFLYLKTKKYFYDPDSHIRSIGDLYRTGATREATLIQMVAIGARDGSRIIARVKRATNAVGCRPFSKKGYRLDLHRFNDKTYKKEFSEVDFTRYTKLFNALKVGAYMVNSIGSARMRGHAMVFIKESAELSYFFNPDVGIYKITGKNQFEQLIPLIPFLHYDVTFEKLELA